MENKKQKIFYAVGLASIVILLVLVVLAAVKINGDKNDLAVKTKNITELTEENRALDELADTYTVFFADDEAVVKKVLVKRGESVDAADMPAVPHHDGCFTFWSADGSDILEDTVIFCKKYPVSLTITGECYVGETLRATLTGESPATEGITYLWLDENETELFRETPSTGYSEYPLTAADTGKRISVKAVKEGYTGTVTKTTPAAVSTAKKMLLTVSISSFQTEITITVNDNAETAYSFSYSGGGVAGTFYAREGDKIEVCTTNGDRPIKIYSYTDEELPASTDDMTLEAGDDWANVPSLSYTLGTDTGVAGYYVAVTPEYT